MNANRRMLVAAIALVMLGTVGLVEAARLGHPGLVVVLAASIAVAITLVLGFRDRTLLTLRPDLAGWITRTTAATGEPPERLVDRAVSSYRARLDTGWATGRPAGQPSDRTADDDD